MIKTLLTLLLLSLISFDSWGDDYDPPSLEATIKGRDALAAFNATPPFLAGQERRDIYLSEVMEICDAPAPQHLRCLEFAQANKEKVRQSIPNNPAYWANFWRLMSLSPVGKEKPGRVDLLGPRYNRTNLFDPVNVLLLRSVVLEEEMAGRILEYGVNARRILGESSLSIDKQWFIGMVHSGLRPWSFAMAQANAHDDRSALRELLRVVAPMSVKELSIRGLLESERLALDGFDGEMTLADFQNLHLLSQEDLTDLTSVGLREAKAYYKQLEEVLGEVSERGWAEFWGKGLDETTRGKLPPSHELVFSVFHEAFLHHTSTTRQLDAAFTVARALGDVYAGVVSPGTPARPTPAHFRWDWREDVQALCLLPVSVHESLQRSVTEVCVEYFDPVASF
ncbi:MAG: hypothetical protein GKR90_23935 [Pseudomonadales bacterium]|nr:hypothetical protein [Pseudomonadales bacterium]